MTKVEAIIESLGRLEQGQEDLKLQFNNHLHTHREDTLIKEARYHKYIMLTITIGIPLIITLVGAAYYIGK